MLRGLRERMRWAAGESQAGPVWPPPRRGREQAQLVRVERQIHEVVETVGTPDQLARSGVAAPGGRGPVHEATYTVGELPAGGAQGGLMKDAFVILQSLELWLVRIVAVVLAVGARHPRAVLWLGGLWWLSLVVGP